VLASVRDYTALLDTQFLEKLLSRGHPHVS
jgi:hypothetical protein